MRFIATTISLFSLWLLWSGHYGPLMLSFAASSVLLCAWLVIRGNAASDWFAAPALRFIPWMGWLLVEIVKANIDICKLIWSRKIKISAVVCQVPCSQQGDFARAQHANAITLTPGTLTLAMEDSGPITIMAISRDGADSLKAGDFDRKANQLQ